MEEYISIKEFAKAANVHPSTIRRAIKAGRIQAFRIGPGKRSVFRIATSEFGRMRWCDLQEVIKNHSQELLEKGEK